jgi:hypothetical protein
MTPGRVDVMCSRLAEEYFRETYVVRDGFEPEVGSEEEERAIEEAARDHDAPHEFYDAVCAAFEAGVALALDRIRDDVLRVGERLDETGPAHPGLEGTGAGDPFMRRSLDRIIRKEVLR